MASKKRDNLPINYSPVPVSTTNELFCYEGNFSASSDFKPHRHEWGQLAYVIKGILSVSIEGQRFFCATGDGGLDSRQP
jgi:hypothetical protein